MSKRKMKVSIKLKGYRKFIKRAERVKKELETLRALTADTEQEKTEAEPQEQEETTPADEREEDVFEELKSKPAYGVEWDYGSKKPKLKRVGLSVTYREPHPAESTAEKGWSPFDDVLPWAGMKRCNVIHGRIAYTQEDERFSQILYDTVVYIPDFWYVARKDEKSKRWLWMISPEPLEGFKKHPGSGRYIGRYHSGEKDGKTCTISDIIPLTETTRDEFNQMNSRKGDGWRMLDMASWAALQMLYLVEYADFNSRETLGSGCTTGKPEAGGETDNARYHTIKNSGGHNQYRWIEDPFSNVLDMIDGFAGSTEEVCIQSGKEKKLTKTQLKLPDWGYISGFGYDPEYDWAFIPDETDAENGDEGACAYANASSSSRPAYVGGFYYDNDYCGFFCLYAYGSASYTNSYLGSRLLFET